MIPRGIRNNNPGNIRLGQDWVGERHDDTPDSAFEEFLEPKYGVRALGRIMDTYFYRHGLRTIEKIISRWAPPSENDTGAYIRSVANEMRISPTVDLTFPAQKPALVAAIIRHENGVQPYAMDDIREWSAL